LIAVLANMSLSGHLRRGIGLRKTTLQAYKAQVDSLGPLFDASAAPEIRLQQGSTSLLHMKELREKLTAACSPLQSINDDWAALLINATPEQIAEEQLLQEQHGLNEAIEAGTTAKAQLDIKIAELESQLLAIQPTSPVTTVMSLPSVLRPPTSVVPAVTLPVTSSVLAPITSQTSAPAYVGMPVLSQPGNPYVQWSGCTPQYGTPQLPAPVYTIPPVYSMPPSSASGYSTALQQPQQFAIQPQQFAIQPPVNLPRLQLPKFNGNPLEFNSFQDMFTNNILAKPYDEQTKFYLLKTMLVGPAHDLVRGLTTTNSNFQEAWEMVQRRFGDQQRVRDALYDKLRYAKHVGQRLEDLRRYTDNVDSVVRQLRTAQEPVDNPVHSAMFVRMIFEHLPKEVILELEMHRQGEWTLPTLTEALQRHIQLKERVERYASGGKSTAKVSEEEERQRQQQ
jgi:hypothetical protein